MKVQETEFDQYYHEVEKLAYETLFRYIRSSIIPNKQVVLMTTLTHNLVKFMLLRGVTEPKLSTKKALT